MRAILAIAEAEPGKEDLDAILSVGYRVNSKRGTQFRMWATQRLREYLIKGFTLDDERLKAGRNLGTDYFDELLARIREIRASGARICFVGLGCPRQEVFVWAMRDRLAMPALAVGAAFDYHAGLQAEPPHWVQRWGLQWLWRLAAEPTRLWRRYLLLNPAYLALLAAQRLRIWRPKQVGTPPDPGAAIPS